MWVGDYDNRTCSFSISDSELRLKVSRMAHDSRIAGYFFSDEPDPQACPHAPKQHKLRSSLIHSLDPGKPTILLMDSNSGRASLNQMPLWLGASDYVALDPYPCYQGKPCRYSWIDAVIKAADRTGLHYWGVVQAFNDETWRWPKPTELRHMLAQWAHSKESGQMTFSMSWAGNKLSSQPALLRVLRAYNHRCHHRQSPSRQRTSDVRCTERGARGALHDYRTEIGRVLVDGESDDDPLRPHQTVLLDRQGDVSLAGPDLVGRAVLGSTARRAEAIDAIPLLDRR